MKADVGLRAGKIVGIGKAGNPSTMDGVTPGLTTGTSTDAISGEHLILTAGGMDTHVHYISPQQVYAALSNGITTLWGGGIGPADGIERRDHDQRAVEPGDDAARDRGAADQFRPLRQGQFVGAQHRWSSSSRRVRPASRCMRTTDRRRPPSARR